MALLNVLAHFKEFFRSAPCNSCIARDYHIASLKEIIHQRDEFILQLETAFARQDENKNELIDHFLGRNRVVTKTSGELHSVARNQGIQGRIQRAERADREKAEPVIAQREREFKDRIAALEKPEIEIVEKDAV